MKHSLIEKNFAELMQHPSEYFTTPQDVMNLSLSSDQKIKLLEQWKDEVMKRQIANEENMLGTDYADLLQVINNAFHSLKNEMVSIQ